MQTKIKLVSVPHSGTQLIESWFKKAGFIKCGFEQYTISKPEGDNILLVDHAFDNIMKFIKKQDCPSVAPLRHLFLIEESWRRRGKSINEMLSCMDNLIFLKPDWVIPIDNDHTKHETAEAMMSSFGIDDVIHWDIVGSLRNTYNMTWEDCEPSAAVKEYYNATRSFWDKYY